jgi:hypothetical protein
MVDVNSIDAVDDHDYGNALVHGRDIETGEWGWQWVDTADLADAGVRMWWQGARRAA